MNIILSGGSGAPNYGDELILQQWIRYITTKYPLADLHVQGTSVKGLASSVKVAKNSNKPTYSTSLLSYALEEKNLSFFEQFLRGKRYIEHQVFRKDPKTQSYQEKFERCDVFHLHGGGYMNSFWPAFGFLFGVGAALKKCYNAKFVCTGIGVTPLTVKSKKEHELLKMILNSSDLFGVRDPFGVSFLSEKTHIAPFADIDDAFLEDVKVNPDLINSSTFHISTYSSILKKDKSILETIQRKAEKHESLCIWECCPTVDKEAIETIKKLGFNNKVISIESLLADGIPFGKNHKLFTIRYHPAVQVYRIGGYVEPHFSGDYYTHKHQATHVLGALNQSKQGNFLEMRNHTLVQLKQDQANWIYS